MDSYYQSPWFNEALEKEGNLKVNELNLNLNLRPQNIDMNTYYNLTQILENLKS